MADKKPAVCRRCRQYHPWKRQLVWLLVLIPLAAWAAIRSERAITEAHAQGWAAEPTLRACIGVVLMMGLVYVISSRLRQVEEAVRHNRQHARCQGNHSPRNPRITRLLWQAAGCGGASLLCYMGVVAFGVLVLAGPELAHRLIYLVAGLALLAAAIYCFYAAIRLLLAAATIWVDDCAAELEAELRGRGWVIVVNRGKAPPMPPLPDLPELPPVSPYRLRSLPPLRPFGDKEP